MSSPIASSALVPNRAIPQPHCRAELHMYQDIVSPRSSNPLWRLLPISIDSISSLGQLAFYQLLVLMDSTDLTGMTSPQPARSSPTGSASSSMEFPDPANTSLSFTRTGYQPNCWKAENKGVESGADLYGSSVYWFVLWTFMPIGTWMSQRLPLCIPWLSLAFVSTHLYFNDSGVDICPTDLLQGFW